MTLEEIKAAVDAGLAVHWVNEGYVVHRDNLGQYLTTFRRNGHSIGLTDRIGSRLNGEEAQFFISRPDLGETIHCSECGSDDVLRDGWARWDPELQIWEVSDLQDHAWCNRCDSEAKLVTRPIRDFGGGPQPQRTR